MAPHSPVPGEHIRRTGARRQLIGRAVDPGSGTAFPIRSHHDCIPGHRHRPAKLVTDLGHPHHGWFQIRLLAPRPPLPEEHVRRTGVRCSLTGGAVDPRRRTVFPDRTHHHRVPAHSHRPAKPVIGLGAPDRCRFQVRLLGPHPTTHREHIRRPGFSCRLIGRAVDPQRGAPFLGRPHHHRISAYCHGIAKPVACLRRPNRGGFQVRLLGNRVDRDRVTRATLFHFQPQSIRFADEAGGQFAALGIGHLQSGVVQRRRPVIVQKAHPLSVRRNARRQRPPHRQVQRERRGARARTRRERKAVLQPAPAIDEPLRHQGVPPVREFLHVGNGASMLDAAFLAGKAVAPQLQSPAPAARVGCDVKPAAVEAGHPLLPIVPRPMSAILWECRLAMALVFRADTRPGGCGEAHRSWSWDPSRVSGSRHCCE